MTITVMVCTWNRAHYLKLALDQMCKLRIPAGVKWELLIINNNCADNTDEIISGYSNALPVRRLFEPCPGKSYAANFGLQHAHGELVICTDDDVLVSVNWLEEYVNAAREWPNASFFGGTIDPWLEVEPPRWIKEHFLVRGPYSILQHGPDVRPMLPDEAGPFGANMAIRTSLFKVFRFNTKLGPIQQQILPADDGEFIARLKRAGHWGVWVGPARVQHHIAKELLTTGYIWEWFREQGRSLVVREGKTNVRQFAGVPLWALRQHCESRLRSWCASFSKNDRWAKAYAEAARTFGIIQESRALYARSTLDVTMPANCSAHRGPE